MEPDKMGGVPCIRGLRVPVATVVGMVAEGMTTEEILEAYPYLAVLNAAVSEGRVLITLDTDFGALAARSRSQPASVILFRGHVTRRPSAQASHRRADGGPGPPALVAAGGRR